MFKPLKIKGLLCQILWMFLFITLASCGEPAEQTLIIALSPMETLVVETPKTLSCKAQLTGTGSTTDPFPGGDVSGPLIKFNRFAMEWTKASTTLYINSARIVFTSQGISGGQVSCDLTEQLPFLFEGSSSVNANADPTIFTNGAFIQKGKIVSNPVCRIPCTIPLADPNVPEITAFGELVVKGTEVINEGEINEVNYRVRSRFVVRIIP